MKVYVFNRHKHYIAETVVKTFLVLAVLISVSAIAVRGLFGSGLFVKIHTT